MKAATKLPLNLVTGNVPIFKFLLFIIIFFLQQGKLREFQAIITDPFELIQTDIDRKKKRAKN